MLTARLVDGEPIVVDRLREPVQLAAGLDNKRKLKGEVVARALECLRRFGQRLREMPGHRVRVVGTNTLRVARDAGTFVEQAEQALGFPVDIVSGAEEARLIYLGVSHTLPDDGRARLVADIGGGSTECILGRGFEILEAHSLHMGCVGFSQKFFADGRIDKKAMDAAMLAARLELQTLEHRFQEVGWDHAVGSSGTMRAVCDVLRSAPFGEPAITPRGLRALRKAMCAAGSAEALKLDGLRRDRANVFAGGVAIVSAIVETFELDVLPTSDGSMREGVLYDMLGRIRHEDIRERTIRIFQERYHVDAAQAARVERSAEKLWSAAPAAWRPEGSELHNLLRWAARLHELGLAVSYRHHHHHGRYLIDNSDMPGFSRNEQVLLATLVGLHRRKLQPEMLAAVPAALREAMRGLVAILRLAVVFNRSRAPKPVVPRKIAIERDRIALRFAEGFAEEHPLTMEDLRAEADMLRAFDLKLRLREASDGEGEFAEGDG